MISGGMVGDRCRLMHVPCSTKVLSSIGSNTQSAAFSKACKFPFGKPKLAPLKVKLVEPRANNISRLPMAFFQTRGQGKIQWIRRRIGPPRVIDLFVEYRTKCAGSGWNDSRTHMRNVAYI